MTAVLTDRELLGRLVAFDSTSSNSNVPIADFICNYVDGLGVDVVRNFNNDRTKVNLVLRVPGTASRAGPAAGLTLSGHVDTVPATEKEWQSDPFTLTERDDRYIARGACDMKGFVALAVNTIRHAAQGGSSAGIDDRRVGSAGRRGAPRNSLVCVLSFDEEPGILGAQHFARTWDRPFELPKATVVGEPTEMRVVRMHKGHLKMRIVFRGKTAHTGYAHLGVNAIEPAGRVIVALTDFHRELANVRSPTSEFFPNTPSPTAAVTRIHGGTATNVVPDECVLDFGIRLLPDMDPAEWEQRVRARLADTRELGDHTVEECGLSAPFCTDEDTPIYRTLCDLVLQLGTYAVSYASDAGPLQQMGHECVLFGPGSIEVAHKPNEWLPKREFSATRDILDRLVETFCRS